MRQLSLMTLAVATLAGGVVALAADLKIPPPVKPKERPVHANQPNCSRWTDACVNCSRGAGGAAPTCSNIGFACQPKAIRCLAAEPSPAEPQKK